MCNNLENCITVTNIYQCFFVLGSILMKTLNDSSGELIVLLPKQYDYNLLILAAKYNQIMSGYVILVCIKYVVEFQRYYIGGKYVNR